MLGSMALDTLGHNEHDDIRRDLNDAAGILRAEADQIRVTEYELPAKTGPRPQFNKPRRRKNAFIIQNKKENDHDNQ